MFNKVFFAVLCSLLLFCTVEAKIPVRTQSVAPQRATDQIDSFYIPSDAGIGNELRGKFSAARALITKKDYALADSLLDALIKEFEALMVDTKNNRYVCIRYDSDYEQFLKEEAADQPGKDRRPIIRVHASFSRALQLKGWIAVDQKEWVKALDCFKKEMQYTPYEPDQYIEQGVAFNQSGSSQKVFESYQRAYALAEAHGNNVYDKAIALRGMGYSLIDLAKLDEATALFEKSLILDPGNKIALNEISYIKMLKVRNKAESGDAASQFKLGWLYTTGTILSKNYTEGVKWYRLAAEQGDVNAETCLGFAYLTGNGVERSDTEAVKWSRLAAEQGDAFAQCNVGLAYAKGLGVDKNSEEAIKWFLAAANQGMAEAQYNMGNAYSKGEGVEVNKATAKAWYQKACANGYKPACDVLKNNF